MDHEKDLLRRSEASVSAAAVEVVAFWIGFGLMAMSPMSYVPQREKAAVKDPA